MSSIDALVDWLIDGAPGAAEPSAVVLRLGNDIVASGIPVDRLAAFVSTLHPSIAGRSFRWSPGLPVDVGEAPHSMFETDGFKKSPVGEVYRDRVEKRIRIAAERATGHSYDVIKNLAAEGFTDYAAFPIVFMNGEGHAITFATKAERGFSDGDIDALRRVVRPLSRVAEILALRRTAATLLSTYVGRNSGERILAGRIKPGDFETLRAVIWFSDLRSFTEMSSLLPTRDVIDTLNKVFERQVAPVEKRGGEVLKFMGDGMLAIFPLADGANVSEVADRAILAAKEAVAAITTLVPERRIGIALHVGELAYGNVGGSNRLDFTAIGPAVNLASRLEGLTSKLGRVVVLSEELAHITTKPIDDLGMFDLKGFAAPVRVFAPKP